MALSNISWIFIFKLCINVCFSSIFIWEKSKRWLTECNLLSYSYLFFFLKKKITNKLNLLIFLLLFIPFHHSQYYWSVNKTRRKENNNNNNKGEKEREKIINHSLWIPQLIYTLFCSKPLFFNLFTQKLFPKFIRINFNTQLKKTYRNLYGWRKEYLER